MGEPIRLLHVEDDPEFAELTAEFLDRADHAFDVVCVTDPADGLDHVEDDGIDCVVSDYEMPGRNGVEFLRDVRETDPDLPFILFTGKGSEEVASDAISAGATDYIQKGAGATQYEVLANRIKNAVEQHRSRRDLEASEKRLSLFVEQSPLGVIEWNDRFEFVRLNDTAEEILGYEEAELVGTSWERVVPPEDRDEIGDVVVDDLLADEGGFHSVNENLTKDGERILCEWYNHVVKDEGEVIAVFSQFQEVTDRRDREQTLERLVQRTADLIESTTTQETARVAVDIARTVLGAPLAGIHLRTHEDRLEAVAMIDDVEEEIDLTPTYRRERDDPKDRLVWETLNGGDPRYIEDVSAVEGLAEATPARSVLLQPLEDRGVLIISATEPEAFDQTDRLYANLLAKTVTAALEKVERETMFRSHTARLERLHGTAESLHRAGSREEIAELVVEAAKDLFGSPYTAVRYFDEAVDGLVPAATSDATESVLGQLPTFGPDGGSLNWAAYEAGASALYEDISDLDRAVHLHSTIDSLMLFPMGEHGTISVGDDSPQSFDETDRFHGELLAGTAELALTQLDRETTLVEQRDLLDRQNERLEQFASVVSHDLRNPLNVASGRLELAREECDSDHLDVVAEAHDRMTGLIDDLLTLALSGDRIGEVEPIELSELVESCWRNVDTADATLEVEVDGPVAADRSRLSQLLENLIRNAVEHGGDDVTVTVGELDGGFYVEDDGPGIPADNRDDVFEPGFTTTDTGTGFGLPIVREIARAHGWSIAVTAGTDGGARFEVTGLDAER